MKHSDPQHPDEVIKIKKLNLVLQKKLEDSENERLTSQQELEEVIQVQLTKVSNAPQGVKPD